MCNLRHNVHGKGNFTPAGSADTVAKGAYYLSKVDELYRREYIRKE
jgi:hydroxymethylglutaryl-CoA synthase